MPNKNDQSDSFEYRGPHHIIPSSRGGSDSPDNIYPEHLWPPEKGQHIHWHYIFENMRPDEAVKTLKKYTDRRHGDLDEGFFDVFFVISKPWKKLNKNPNIKERSCSYKRTKRNKESWSVLFPDMNGRDAINWIGREFIRKEWL